MLKMADVIAAAQRDDGTGFCRSCGNEESCVEPDARRVRCSACGEPEVYGVEELIIMGDQL